MLTMSQTAEAIMMKRNRSLRVVLAATLVLALQGCGYNTLVSQKERVDSAWSEIENQLQRRNDLIPNLVETVKGFAAQEKTC
jgi:LemA protein